MIYLITDPPFLNKRSSVCGRIIIYFKNKDVATSMIEHFKGGDKLANLSSPHLGRNNPAVWITDIGFGSCVEKILIIHVAALHYSPFSLLQYKLLSPQDLDLDKLLWHLSPLLHEKDIIFNSFDNFNQRLPSNL